MDTGEVGGAGAELAEALRQYRELASRIADLGLIHRGSVVHRHAAGDPAGRKPYFQWSGKTAGKTVTRTLSPEEAGLYREWIANDRALQAILKDMRRVCEHAAQLILAQKVK